MGVGYSASPLHRISYLDTSSMPGRPAVRGDSPLMDLLIRKSGGRSGNVTVFDGPMRLRSPPKADILAWRDRVASKYRSQIGEDFSWDEDSAFEQSEDAATSADVLLRYVAAVLDQRGQSAVRGLVNTRKPAARELDRVFAEAARRGFGGQFPQLLLGAHYWFPFQRHLIIEEPDWMGNVERYGSTFRLMDELLAVQTSMSNADTGATTWTANQFTTPESDVLAAAWQANNTVSRLCTNAISLDLPLWTTG